MKDRTMLILLLLLGILCISVRESEDGMQFVLPWQSASTERQLAETVTDTVDKTANVSTSPAESSALEETYPSGQGNSLAGGTDENGKLSLAKDTVQQTVYHIVKADTSQMIRVLLSPLNNGTYLQPSVQIKDTVYTAEGLQGKTVKLQLESPVQISFGETKDPRKFSGALYLYPDGDSVYVVNEVDLEEYTANVVPGEMPAYYPAEALKAQAVCARTYALKHIDGEAGYHADVDDTVSSQVYNNTGRKDSTDQAVSDTEGLILADQEGKAAQLYFYSTSYGFCSLDDVWVEKPKAEILRRRYLGAGAFRVDTDDIQDEKMFAAYIRSEDAQAYETDEPWFRWKVTIPVEKLMEFCRKKDASAEEVTSVEITRRASGYAAKELTVSCGQQKLVIEGEYAIREFLSPENLSLINQKETVTDRKVLPSSYIVIDPVAEHDALTAVTVYGGGYGHGVGLSQNGAKHMAASGMDYTQILAEFFDIS